MPTLTFVRRFFATPRTVGSLLPSSPWLVDVLIEPFVSGRGSAHVLELGAGTGVVTRRIASELTPGDRLDICEIDESFLKVLQGQLQTFPPLALAHEEERVRLLSCPAQQISGSAVYDFIISALPLNAFDEVQVRQILDRVRQLLRPGGVFSYFEYVALRHISRYLSPAGKTRDRLRRVSGVLAPRIRRHQFARRTVWRNLPPAWVRHWSFD